MTDTEYKHQLYIYNITTTLIDLLQSYVPFSNSSMQYLYRKSIHPQLIKDMEDFFYNASCEDMEKHNNDL